MSSYDVVADGDSCEEHMEEALGANGFFAGQVFDVAEAEIVEAAKTDPIAFGELYERYYVRVYRYIYHRVGHASDAEDVTGLVFMKALEGLPNYRQRGNGFAPWIFRIARNAVIDHYRRRRPQATLDVLLSAPDDADPVGDVLGKERRTELTALVEGLSADQRDVVLLRYAADLSFTEIAAILQKNEAAVRMLLHRGLKKLKVVLGDGRAGF